MRPDNKVAAFPGRGDTDIEYVMVFDTAVKKDIAIAQSSEWPRFDEQDGNTLARDSIDYDYTNRRIDAEMWTLRKTTNNDLDNNTYDEEYHVNEHRAPEDPDQFGANEALFEGMCDAFEEFIDGEE